MNKRLGNLKNMLNTKPLFGSFIPFASGEVAEYTVRLGFDYVIIDNEHGIMNQETIFDMIRSAQCQNIPVIVRNTNNTPDYIHKVLDIGAEGVLVPVINTAEDVKQVLKTTLYPPEGERGTAYFTRASSYGMIKDKKRYLKETNEKIFISIQIETADAIKNLDEILNIDRIDMFFIGPNDLAASFGVDTSDSKLTFIIEETLKKITSKGKTAGIFVNNVEDVKKYSQLGATFFLTSILKYMTNGVEKYLKEARNKDE